MTTPVSPRPIPPTSNTTETPSASLHPGLSEKQSEFILNYLTETASANKDPSFKELKDYVTNCSKDYINYRESTGLVKGIKKILEFFTGAPSEKYSTFISDTDLGKKVTEFAKGTINQPNTPATSIDATLRMFARRLSSKDIVFDVQMLAKQVASSAQAILAPIQPIKKDQATVNKQIKPLPPGLSLGYLLIPNTSSKSLEKLFPIESGNNTNTISLLKADPEFMTSYKEATQFTATAFGWDLEGKKPVENYNPPQNWMSPTSKEDSLMHMARSLAQFGEKKSLESLSEYASQNKLTDLNALIRGLLLS